MAVKKGKALTLSTLALKHGDSAAGAKHVKKGFAFTPEMDLAFALGYPHMIHLADGHPADEDPVEAGLAFVDEQGLSARIWPREVASRAARSFVFLPDKDDDRTEAFEKSGPITEAEARDIIDRWLDADRAEVLILLLEALVGPDVVLGAAIDTLEKYDDEQWTGGDLDLVVYELGYLLLRVPEAAAKSARERLEAVYDKVQKAGWESRAVSYFDVMLHGKEGAERSGYRPGGAGKPVSALFLGLVEDGKWVEKAALAAGAPDASRYPDPRLSFLGGEKILEAEASWWKKYTKPGAQALFIERFGHIRSEALLPAFLEMTTSSKAKKEATAWFVAHADFARAFLDKQAKGKDGDAAKAVLKAIG